MKKKELTRRLTILESDVAPLISLLEKYRSRLASLEGKVFPPDNFRHTYVSSKTAKLYDLPDRIVALVNRLAELESHAAKACLTEKQITEMEKEQSP